MNPSELEIETKGWLILVITTMIGDEKLFEESFCMDASKLYFPVRRLYRALDSLKITEPVISAAWTGTSGENKMKTAKKALKYFHILFLSHTTRLINFPLFI